MGQALSGAAKTKVKIDVISDVVCPWCYIGKRRLEGALKLFKAQYPALPQPEVRWWPFQLNPEMPAEGIDRGTYLEQKFGSANVTAIYARVTAAGVKIRGRLSRRPAAVRA
mgnify:CR=1 FL=1